MPEKENAPSTEVNPTLFLKTKKKKNKVIREKDMIFSLTKCFLLLSGRIVFMPERQNKRSTAFSKAKEI